MGPLTASNGVEARTIHVALAAKVLSDCRALERLCKAQHDVAVAADMPPAFVATAHFCLLRASICTAATELE